MAFNISSFFSGSAGGTDGGFGTASWLSDYRSIKNGSYGKLMKAYYKESGTDSVSSSKANKAKNRSVVDDIISEKMKVKKESAESKAYTAVKKATDDLTSAVDKLATDGDKSVFAQKVITTKDENGVESSEFGYDKESIYNAVNDFVKAYNSVLSTSNSAGSSSISNRAADMMKETKNNEQTLNQFGISIKADGSLSINKDNFMKADMKSMENFFTGEKNQYTKNVTAMADMIRSNASYEQLRAATYTSDGTFDSTQNSGKTFSSSL